MTEEKLTESVQGEGAMQAPAQKEEKTKIVYEGGGSLDARPGQDGDGVLIDDGRIEAMKEYLSPEELYQDLIARVRRYHPSDDITMIEKAYQVAAKAHEGAFRKGTRIPYITHPMETALIVNFWVISVTLVISVLTNTAAATYTNSGIGLLGWFSTSNAQSAVVSMLAPIVIAFCYRKKHFWLFCLTTAAAFAQLYFLGTRLAFLSIFAVALGLPVVLLLTRQAKTSKRYIAVLIVMLVVCCAFVKQSPMYINQNRYNLAMTSKQGDAEVMIRRTTGDSEDLSTVDPAERYHALCTIYNFYSPKLCQRFGTARVMSAYDYSDQVTDITATRHRKIVFCSMLMDEHPFVSRIFGMELSRMSFDGDIYDVENDFHGIYFLYGWAGLALMVAFVAYFLYLVAKFLIQDFHKYFTSESGAYGISLCLCLIYAYCTAGMLRRPNASVYMSVLLAAVYYLTQMRSEQPDALPDGEEKTA